MQDRALWRSARRHEHRLLFPDLRPDESNNIPKDVIQTVLGTIVEPAFGFCNIRDAAPHVFKSGTIGFAIRNRPGGWIAVSEFLIRVFPEKYGWVDKYKPERIVGKTIRLHHFDMPPSG